MARVTPPDLELWLTRYLRGLRSPAFAPDAAVDVREPRGTQADPFPATLIIVRDDGGPRTSPTTFERSIGVTVLAGTQQLAQPANDLSRTVFAVLTDPDIALAPGSPIAAVIDEGCNGPYSVPETQDRTRRYMTVQYVVVGSL